MYFFAFYVANAARRARLDIASIVLDDFWSHKTHVTRDNRSGALVIAKEGEARGTTPAGMLPDWVTANGTQVLIDLGQGHLVTYVGNGARCRAGRWHHRYAPHAAGRLALDAPRPLPDWINASKNLIAVKTDAGRFNYSRSKVETFRYQPGWQLVFFTLNSPFYGKGPLKLAELTDARSHWLRRSCRSALVGNGWYRGNWLLGKLHSVVRQGGMARPQACAE